MFAATVASLLLGQLSADAGVTVVVTRGIGVPDGGAALWGERVAGALRGEGLPTVEGPGAAEARLPGVTEQVLACDREPLCVAARGRALGSGLLLTVDVAVLGERAALKVEALQSADGLSLEQESGSLTADADENAVSDLLAGFALRVRKRLETPGLPGTDERGPRTSPLFFVGGAVAVAGLAGGTALLFSARADRLMEEDGIRIEQPRSPSDASRLRERANLKQTAGIASLVLGAAGVATAVVFRPRADGAPLAVAVTANGVGLTGQF